MNCAKASDLMSDYIDGQLPGQTEQELELHLRDCPRCAVALKELRSMLCGLAELAVRQPTVDCWPAVRMAILEPKRRAYWLSWFTRPIAWGSAFAVTVVIAVLALLPLGKGPAEPVRVGQAAEYRTYMAAHSKVERQHSLSDPNVAFITAEIENASYNTVGR